MRVRDDGWRTSTYHKGVGTRRSEGIGHHEGREYRLPEVGVQRGSVAMEAGQKCADLRMLGRSATTEIRTRGKEDFAVQGWLGQSTPQRVKAGTYDKY